MIFIAIIWTISSCINSQHVELDKKEYYRFALLNATLKELDEKIFDVSVSYIEDTHKNILEYIYSIENKEYYDNNHIYKPFVLEGGRKFLTLFNIDACLHNTRIGFYAYDNKNQRKGFYSTEIKINAIFIKKRSFDVIREQRSVFNIPTYINDYYKDKINFKINQKLDAVSFGICDPSFDCKPVSCAGSTCSGYSYGAYLYLEDKDVTVQYYKEISFQYFIYVSYKFNSEIFNAYSLIMEPYDNGIELEYLSRTSFSYKLPKIIDKKIFKIEIYWNSNSITEHKLLAECDTLTNVCKEHDINLAVIKNGKEIHHKIGKRPTIIKFQSYYGNVESKLYFEDFFQIIIMMIEFEMILLKY